MKVFGINIFGPPKMEASGTDQFLEQLANHLVSAATGGGDYDIFLPGNRRDRFISIPGLARAVDVISSMAAQVMCNGHMTIRNADDEVVENRRTGKVLELLTHSPDGVLGAHSFIEDTMADYLLDGNALVRMTSMMNGVPVSLRRYQSYDAYLSEDGGPLVYYAQEAFDNGPSQVMVPVREMAHMRWPILRRDIQGDSSRRRFSTSPITLLARAYITGILQGRYVEGRYRHPVMSSAAMIFDSEKTPAVDQEQTKALRAALVERLTGSPVAMGFDATVTEISNAPVNDQVMTAMSWQLQEIVRIYGLPLPLLSTPLGQWTRGINEQIMKLAWRTCFSLHLKRLLSAMKVRMLRPNEFFHVDSSELLRGDAQGIAEFLNATQGDAQRNPIASRRELRRYAGFPREVDGEIVDTVQPKEGMDAEPASGVEPTDEPRRPARMNGRVTVDDFRQYHPDGRAN